MATIVNQKIKSIKSGYQNDNWSVTEDEFKAMIKGRENGPFISIQESMQNFDTWLKSREKK
jgi:hypothetical protein